MPIPTSRCLPLQLNSIIHILQTTMYLISHHILLIQPLQNRVQLADKFLLQLYRSHIQIILI